MESLADFMLCESLFLASHMTAFFLCLHRIEGARDLSQGSFSWGLLSLDGTGSRIIPLAFPGNSKSSVVIAGSLF